MKIITELMTSNVLGRMIGAGISQSVRRLSAGLGIDSMLAETPGERANVQIRCMDRAIGNLQDGIALSRITDSVLADIECALGEMRTLADRCATNGVSAVARTTAQEETARLRARVEASARAAQERKAQILGQGEISLSYLAQRTENIVSSLSEFSGAVGAFVSGEGLSAQCDFPAELCELETPSLATPQAAARAADDLGGLIASVGSRREALKAQTARMQDIARNLSASAINLRAATTRIADAAVARSIAAGTKFHILAHPRASLAGQANQRCGSIVRLTD